MQIAFLSLWRMCLEVEDRGWSCPLTKARAVCGSSDCVSMHPYDQSITTVRSLASLSSKQASSVCACKRMTSSIYALACLGGSLNGGGVLGGGGSKMHLLRLMCGCRGLQGERLLVRLHTTATLPGILAARYFSIKYKRWSDRNRSQAVGLCARRFDEVEHAMSA